MTPFQELDRLVADLAIGAHKALADNFCGAYLQGSFALGYADEYSDVDFLVVTEGELTDGQQRALQALHQRLYAMPTTWAQHLEGSYIPRDVLQQPDPTRRPLFYIDNGATEFTFDNHDNTAVVRWTLREHGLTLAGPSPRELVDQITAEDLRADARWSLGEWAAWLASIDSMSRRGLGVGVLTICRVMHTLAIGEVTPKPVAGKWVLETLNPEWKPLIQWALDDRADPWTKVLERAGQARFERLRAFVDYAAKLAT